MNIQITTVTTKGQATIPKSIREFLNIKPNQKIKFEKKGNDIVLRPVRDFMSLAGTVKLPEKYKNANIDEILKKARIKAYEEKEKNSRH